MVDRNGGQGEHFGLACCRQGTLVWCDMVWTWYCMVWYGFVWYRGMIGIVETAGKLGSASCIHLPPNTLSPCGVSIYAIHLTGGHLGLLLAHRARALSLCQPTPTPSTTIHLGTVHTSTTYIKLSCKHSNMAYVLA